MVFSRGAVSGMLALWLASLASAFVIHTSLQPSRIDLFLAARPRSRVVDPAGSTPSIEADPVETINVEDLEELKYDEKAHPIPHQPWRRGLTAGCEDPIDADWRLQGEEVMRKAVEIAVGDGAMILDVTWYLTQVVVTIDEERLHEIPMDLLKTSGAVIEVLEPQLAMYKDPTDPNPEDLWADEIDTEPVYQKEESAEQDIKSKMYARAEEGEEDLGLKDEDDEDVPLYASHESREDDALRVTEEAELKDLKRGRPVARRSGALNTQAISLIAGSIIDALEMVEEDLQILDRHEVVLSSRGAIDVLETQKQFDSHRGFDVAVETQDPWDSNRTLRGKLVDRNSMDVILNVKGRMVTIPLNFVKCVRLPQAKRNAASDYDAFESGKETKGDINRE